MSRSLKPPSGALGLTCGLSEGDCHGQRIDVRDSHSLRETSAHTFALLISLMVLYSPVQESVHDEIVSANHSMYPPF